MHDQLGHHQMAAPRIQARFARYQIEDHSVDLQLPQRTSHGTYWYNLHVVLVHRERWTEVRGEYGGFIGTVGEYTTKAM